MVDEAVWAVLLGLDAEGTGESPEAAGTAADGASAAAAPSGADAGKPYSALFAAALQQRGAAEGGVAAPAVRAEVELTVTDSVQSTPEGGLRETVTVHEEIRWVHLNGERRVVVQCWGVQQDATLQSMVSGEV